MDNSAAAAIDRETVRADALDPAQVQVRHGLAGAAAMLLADAGNELYVIGHFVGEDRKAGISSSGHGSDAVVAISVLLRIASQLIGGAASLIAEGRHYAAAALIRQLVEVEYLAWAFEAKNAEAARWLRSTADERRDVFTPAKLRKAAEGRFRGTDYGYHCELGGHPVPGSWRLLNDDGAMSQLMLSDGLGHVGRIWDHIVGWSQDQSIGDTFSKRTAEMVGHFSHWKGVDALTQLPPPPELLAV